MKLLGHASPSPWTTREKLRRAAWVIARLLVFRWTPARWMRWRNAVLRCFGAQIDDRDRPPARVWPDADIYFPWHLQLGAGCLIGPGCRIYNLGRIILDDGVNLSRHVHLCAGSHDYARWELPLVTAPIHIERNVWVAADTFVGPGVTIGAESVVGARSVVMKDLPPGMLCHGHPCRPVKTRPPLT